MMQERVSTIEIENALLSVNALRVAELKELLGLLSQRKSGRRDDLLFRIHSYIREIATSIPFSPYKWAGLAKSISTMCASTGRTHLTTTSRISAQRASANPRVRRMLLQNSLQRTIPQQVVGNPNFTPRVVFLGASPHPSFQQEINPSQVHFAESILWKFSHRIGKSFLWDHKGYQSFFSFTIPVTASMLHFLSIGGGTLNRLLCFVGPYDTTLEKPISVEYPPTCELIMYCEKMNIRKYFGIKGKPWSAHPIDIGSFLNKKVGKHEIRLVIKNAPPRKYVVDFQVVNDVPISSIVKEIEETRFVDKSIILKEAQSAEPENDVVQTVEKVPLTDPTTLQRITVPCKDPGCSHAQCFDCATFFELNKSIPTWTCPICSKRINPRDIYVDGLFTEILMLTSTSVNIIKLYRNGNWTVPKDNKFYADANNESEDIEKLETSDIFEGSDKLGGSNSVSGINELLYDQRCDDQPLERNNTTCTPNRRKNNEPRPVFIDLTVSDTETNQPNSNEVSVPHENLVDTNIYDSASTEVHSASPIMPCSRHNFEFSGLPLYIDNPAPDNSVIQPSEDFPSNITLTTNTQPFPPSLNTTQNHNTPSTVATDSDATARLLFSNRTSTQNISSHNRATPPIPQTRVNPSLNTLTQWNTPNDERYTPRVLPALLDGYWGEF